MIAQGQSGQFEPQPHVHSRRHDRGGHQGDLGALDAVSAPQARLREAVEGLGRVRCRALKGLAVEPRRQARVASDQVGLRESQLGLRDGECVVDVLFDEALAGHASLLEGAQVQLRFNQAENGFEVVGALGQDGLADAGCFLVAPLHAQGVRKLDASPRAERALHRDLAQIGLGELQVTLLAAQDGQHQSGFVVGRLGEQHALVDTLGLHPLADELVVTCEGHLVGPHAAEL